MRAVVGGLICLLLLVPAAAEARGMFDMPSGWWTLREGDVTTCLEVHDDHTLRLTFQGEGDRNPIVVDGTYRVTATKMADYHATLKVTKVWQKQLTKCRKAWFDAELPETKQLGHTIRTGENLKLTMHFGCSGGHPHVQLCLHADKVVCRDLANSDQECIEGPAIDGSKINAPAN